MKIRISFPLLILPTLLLLNSCGGNRGQSREVQLEATAEDLEAKAEQVRADVKENAKQKIEQAEVIREKDGDDASAAVLEKDASVTREVGELRAEQLEDQAKKIRVQE